MKNVPAARQTGGKSYYKAVKVEGISISLEPFLEALQMIYGGQNEECLHDTNESTDPASIRSSAIL